MTIHGKTIEIFKAENTVVPLVILNNYMKSNGEIYKKCKKLGCPDFTLVEISGLNWDDDYRKMMAFLPELLRAKYDAFEKEKLDEADKLADFPDKRLSHDEVFGKVRASQLLKANKTPVLRDK